MDKSATPESKGAAGDMNKGAADKGAAGKDAAADKATTQTGGFITQQATSQKLAEEFIGMKVESPKKENIGKVTDLILDDQNRIVGAVLSVGGFLGIGDKQVAIPFDQLQMGDNNVILMSQASEEELKSMPAYEEGTYQPLGGLEGGQAGGTQQQ